MVVTSNEFDKAVTEYGNLKGLEFNEAMTELKTIFKEKGVFFPL